VVYGRLADTLNLLGGVVGTDIHLEAERRLDDGTWERIPHMPEPCWSCGQYDRELHIYVNQTGEKPVICRPIDMLPDDVIVDRRGEWVVLERTEPCLYCHGTKFHHPQFLHDRVYDVFAILADVRNGYGFAGVTSSSGFDPIAPGRGLPDDLSREVIDHLARMGEVVDAGQIIPQEREDESDQEDLYGVMMRERDGYWSLGDHSFTWVGLDEILDYDWSRSVTKEGWVDPWEFEQFRKNGAPNSWAGGVSGAGVEHITAGEMAHMIDSGDIVFDDPPGDLGPFDRHPYTTSLQRSMADWSLPEGSVGAGIRDRTHHVCAIQWEVPYRDCVGSVFWQEIEHLKAQAPDGDYSRVRLVMGFDS
jgi:hypothetical protein